MLCIILFAPAMVSPEEVDDRLSDVTVDRNELRLPRREDRLLLLALAMLLLELMLLMATFCNC